MSGDEVIIEPEDSNVEISATGKLRDRRKQMTPVFLALIVALLMSGIGTVINAIILGNVSQVVGYIEDQTSPERQERQREQLKTILIQIDCNVRYAFQESLDQLERQGILAPDSVVITDNCQETTTTTRSGNE